MATHKFRVGQKVQLVATLLEQYAPTADYQIVRQLPDAYGEFYYSREGESATKIFGRVGP
jgi:hypothetical protein